MDGTQKSLRSEDTHLSIDVGLGRIITAIENHHHNETLFKVIAEIKHLIDEYETLPKLLDLKLQKYINDISRIYFFCKSKYVGTEDHGFDDRLVNGVASIALSLARIRGYKFVATFFSSDVYLFPKILHYISSEDIHKKPEESYLLLLWLSNLVLVPFPLESVQTSLASQIYTISIEFVSFYSAASKIQVIALSILALLITRPDGSLLRKKYTAQVIKEWTNMNDNAKLGYLMTFNQILKRASSSEASMFAQEVYHDVVLYELSRIVVHGVKETSTLNVRYLFKVSSKIIRFYINSAQWDIVADAIDSLVYIASSLGDRMDTSLRESLAKSLSRMVAYLSSKTDNYASQLIDYVLDHINDNVDDKAYKPRLKVEVSAQSVPIHHTVLLFMGFLSMTKALPSTYIPRYLSIVHQTSFISYQSTGIFQSSQLRDASCFCMWSLVKSLKKAQFESLETSHREAFTNLFLDSIYVALFDEDFTIRRCGVAVLQEFAGRFGSVFFAKLLNDKSEADIGEFSIKFIELFGSSAFGSLSESHELTHALISMGFPQLLFLKQMIDEIELDLCPFEVKIDASLNIPRILKSSNSNVLLIEHPEVSEHEISDRFVVALTGDNYGALFALAELNKAGLLRPNDVVKVHSIATLLTFNIHSDDRYKGEALLNWFVSVLQTNYIASVHELFPVVIEISHLTYAESLATQFRDFFSVTSLAKAEFEDVCHEITQGNHLLARTICHLVLSLYEVHQLLSLAVDTSVDPQTRAYVIEGLQNHHSEIVNHPFLQTTITSLLDDYSSSAQGDVGLLVRSSCIDLLNKFPEYALKIKPMIYPKLLRISGESLDRLRLCSFVCIHSLDIETIDKEKFFQYRSDYRAYFTDLINYVTSKSIDGQCSESFWTGVILSAGTTVAGNSLINLSILLLIFFLEHHSKASDALDVFLRLLRIPTGKTSKTLSNREKKIIVAVLNVFAKILDASVCLPTTFNYETLFIRCYNLHINTSHALRIGLVLRVFLHLCTNSHVGKELRKKCHGRLSWLAESSKIKLVRDMATDSMLEVLMEVNPESEILNDFEMEKDICLRKLIVEWNLSFSAPSHLEL